jgi:hypothetical protein
MKNTLILALLFLVMVAISKASTEKSTFLDIMKKNLASSDDKAGDINKIMGSDSN